MGNKLGLAASLVLLTCLMASAQQAVPFTERTGDDYVLVPGDKISVSVFGDPELSQPEILISAAGFVTLPLVREVKAAGKSAHELEAAIADAYKTGHYLKDPQVTVIVKEVRTYPVTVGGAVNKPSRLQMLGHMSLLQGITEAGSFHDPGGKITIDRPARTGPDGLTVPEESIVIPVKELQQKPGDPMVNIELRPGDIVTVSQTEYLFVGGAVGKPGKLAMNDVPNWSVLTVLATVGNVTKVAKTEASVIIRTNSDGTKKEIPVNLKLVLQRKNPDVNLVANDILLVPESTGRKALYKAGDTLTGVLGGAALLFAHP